MKPYPKYKDSGVQWIGHIPSSWECVRGKYFMDLITEKSNLSRKVALENIESETGKYFETESSFAGNGVAFKRGDIIYGKLRPYLKKVWLAEFEGNAIGDVFVFRHNIYSNSSFIKYLLLSEAFTKEADNATYGAKMPRVSSNFILNLNFPLPPLKEQQAIVAYLDDKTSKMEECIRLLELQKADLIDYRKAVIFETVTRGLDSNAKLKDSGIEWIGQIPEDWKLCRIKDIVDLKSGTNLTTNEILPEGTYPVYGGNGVRGYYSNFLNDGDFILIGRQGALCGNVNYAHGRFWPTEHAVVCYPKIDFALIWLGELLRTMNLGQYSLSAAQPGLSVERIKNLQIPLPPLSEQQAIADYLDTKTAKIDETIRRIDEQIADLRTYRTALVSDVVTGKIDIRN